MVNGTVTQVTADDLSGLTVIAKYAFYQKERLQSVVLPSGITKIGQGAFEDCDILASVNLPNTVTVIAQTAFRNSRAIQWGDLVLPPNITALTAEVFRNCRLMTSIDVPSGVTTIGQQALSGCQGLTSITLRNPTQVVNLANTNALNNTNNCPIYVPSDLVESYKIETNWATYASRIFAIPTP